MADGNFDKLTVLTSVGIGTETPNAQLHIDANATEGKMLVESGSNLFKLSLDNIGAEIGTVNAIPFTLKTDGSSRLTINALGNVGVDRVNPAFKLDVNGIINATGFHKDGVPWKLQTGDLEDNAVTSAKIADLSVTTNELANGAVTPEKLASNAVTEINLALNVVTTPKIADNAVIAAKIADGAVGTTELANAAIISDKIADAAVIATKIADGIISTQKLSNNAVTTDKILNAAITAAKIAPGVIPSEIGLAVSSSLSNGQTIPPPKGFAVNECIFFAFPKAFTVPAAGAVFNVFADTAGKVTATCSSSQGAVVAVGVAIARKGGWA